MEDNSRAMIALGGTEATGYSCNRWCKVIKQNGYAAPICDNKTRNRITEENIKLIGKATNQSGFIGKMYEYI